MDDNIKKLDNVIDNDFPKKRKEKAKINQLQLMYSNQYTDVRNSKNQLIDKINSWMIFKFIIKLFFQKKITAFTEEEKKLKHKLHDLELQAQAIDKELSIVEKEKNLKTQKLNLLQSVKNEIDIEKKELLELIKKEAKVFVHELRTINKKINNIMKKYVTTYDVKIMYNDIIHLVDKKELFFEFFQTDNEFIHIIEIFNSYQKWQNKVNEIFIQNELIAYSDFFDNVEEMPLTESQRRAIVTNDNANLVLAGAGSGKTSVLVANVQYLLEANLAKEEEILLLAFNKDAANEIESRLDRSNVNSRTFHSFGKFIITDILDKKQLLCDWLQGKNTKEKTQIFFRDLIQNELKNNQNFLSMFTTYFIEDFKPYKSIFSFKTQKEYYNYLKTKNLITLKGDYVKSYEELMIANHLYLKNIEYKYEESYEYNTATKDKAQYHPDFYLPEYKIYIEHFGIDKNGNTASFVEKDEYLKGIEWKRNIHQKKGTILVETYSYENMDGVLLSSLESKLDKYNVEKKDIDFNLALKTLIEDKAVLDVFTDLIIIYQGHFINGNHSIEQILETNHNRRIKTFVKLFYIINNAYEAHKSNCIDYNDMIKKAIDLLKNEKLSQYKYIFVDEFQDISILRNELIKELTKLKQNSCLKVVGDDWQAINKFAGSDVMIIKNFSQSFLSAKRVDLQETFRFGSNIADISKQFIMKNEEGQISKTINTLAHKKSDLYIYWHNNFEKDSIEYIKDIIKHLLNIDPDLEEILFLGRYSFLMKRESLNEIKKCYPGIDISFKTVHSSKGLGKDYVVVLGMDKGKYGFPSELENDPIIDSIIMDDEKFPYAEERRLFYVALTRVKKDIILVAQPYKASPFIKEIIEDNKEIVKNLNENQMSSNPICPKCNDEYLIDKGNFRQCVDIKFCNYTESKLPNCPKCGKENMIKTYHYNIATCQDGNCDGTIKLCPHCKDWHLIDKGNFWGCSNFPYNDCRYTESKKN